MLELKIFCEKLNKDFDSEKNSVHVEAMLLLREYLYAKQKKEISAALNAKNEDEV